MRQFPASQSNLIASISSRYFVYVLFFVVILYNLKEVESYKCIHSEIVKNSPPSVDLTIPYELSRSIAKRDDPIVRKNIRIFLDTTRLDTTLKTDFNYTCYSTGQVITSQTGAPFTCTDKDVLTEAKATFLRDKILVRAEELLQMALLVDPIEGNLTLNPPFPIQSCYGGSSFVKTPIPPEYVNPGLPDTDLIMFVTARKISTDGVFAFAGECYSINGRSVAGYLNFNPSAVSSTPGKDYELNFGAAIHEMTHVLGFSSGKYGAFRYPNGTVIPKSEVLFNTTVNGIPTNKIKTPRVVQWARNHFNCPTIDGVELENQGGEGTAQSHWERRVVLNEYMTGSTSDYPVFSALTLSLLEDAGWYTVNYSAAFPLRWGWNQGCTFVNKKCTEWTGEDYFCKESLEKSCNFDRSAKSVCNLRTMTDDLPAPYRYFTDPKSGGEDQFADYCPYYSNYDGYCNSNANSGNGIIDMGEKYCETCKCFDTSLAKNTPTGTFPTQGCYDTYCTSTTELKVKIGAYWYACSQGSVLEDVGEYSGKLYCPNSDILCIGAKNDTTWPSFESVDPTSGGPGQAITIKGKNFVAGMTVIVNEPATDCEFVDSETYKCKVAGQSEFTNPSHLIGTDEDVVLIVPNQDKSCVGPNAFKLKVAFNADFFKAIGGWMKDNPIITAVVIGGGVLCCLLCCFCCYRERKRMQKRKRGAA